MNNTFISTASTTVDAPASKVWDALTNPDLIKQYLLGTQVTCDWQVGSPIIYQGEWQGKSYQDKGKIVQVEPEKLLAAARKQAQEYARHMFAGDLAENGSRPQLGPVKDLFQGSRIPYHVVIGNHDYRTQTDRTIYDDLYPRQLNYTFEHQGWQFVGLDTSDGIRYQNTSISADTLRWLEDTLPRLNRQRPLVVFTHFPMGPTVTYRPRNAEELLGKFRDFNLQAVFCGHFHGLTERTLGNTVLTTNRCCAISRD
jgi:3',5'-cyclic AMP phosphodiesterase CpdA